MKVNGKIKKGMNYLVVWAYDGMLAKRGDIVSQHKDYQNAQKKAKNHYFWAIVPVDEVEEN